MLDALATLVFYGAVLVVIGLPAGLAFWALSQWGGE